MRMRRKTLRAAARAVAVWLAAVMIAASGSVGASGGSPWGADYFPNVTLTTHHGTPVRFYDDLLKGKIVAINLIYTSCQYACPLETARMAQVQKRLGDRMGRDVFFYSISIDPEHDTPPVLKAYAEQFNAGPGWLFLTGNKADVDVISKKLGLYSRPDPANLDGHMPYLLVGNEVTGQWMRNSAVDNAGFLARTIGEWLNSWQGPRNETLKSYAEVPTRLTLDRGQHTFTNHCAACHTIGRGELLGPDLLGVTATRDPEWLTRFILTPDKVRAGGDPIALALRAKYKQVMMPNLGLRGGDATLLIDYIDRQSRAVREAANAPGAATTPAAAGGARLSLIVEPYLRIQRGLNADSMADVNSSARAIASEAAKLGEGGAAMQAAASELRAAADLNASRAAFARLGDAIMIHAKATGAAIGSDVRVAYCPMAQQYWLQRGEKIQNPFYGQKMSDCGRLNATLPDLKR
jgi:protein SCO1/2